MYTKSETCSLHYGLAFLLFWRNRMIQSWSPSFPIGKHYLYTDSSSISNVHCSCNDNIVFIAYTHEQNLLYNARKVYYMKNNNVVEAMSMQRLQDIFYSFSCTFHKQLSRLFHIETLSTHESRNMKQKHYPMSY